MGIVLVGARRVWVAKKASIWLGARFPRYFQKRVQNPIFVIGYGRSGKTLLARLLALHPCIAYWQEANEVWDPTGYPWHRMAGKTLPAWRDRAGAVARWWRNAEPRKTEIRAIFGAYQWLSHRTWFLNENPMNSFRIPYLVTMFPTARLIHMVRNGGDAVVAVARRQYVKMQSHAELYRAKGLLMSFDELALELADLWNDTLIELAGHDQALGLTEKGILLELKYEDLCADPPGVLAQCCRHAGLDPAGFGPEVQEQSLERQKGQGDRPIDPALAARIREIVGPGLARMGYT